MNRTQLYKLADSLGCKIADGDYSDRGHQFNSATGRTVFYLNRYELFAPDGMQFAGDSVTSYICANLKEVEEHLRQAEFEIFDD